jgi:hypothetical protein
VPSSEIVTTTGIQFDVLNPDPTKIRLRDIVTSLSRINRYLGHGSHPWSVLAHSVCVAQLVPPEYQLTALLHDATEAYLGDVPAPLKELLEFTPYRDAEHRLWTAIAAKCGAHPVIPPVVHDADLAMRWYEARSMKLDQGDCLSAWLEYEAYTDRFPSLLAMRRLVDNPVLTKATWIKLFNKHSPTPYHRVDLHFPALYEN